MAMKTKVMIVEDQGLFRNLLRTSLTSLPSMEVVGDVADGPSAIRLARDKKPHVVLMDIDLGDGLDGIEAGFEIRRYLPKVGIVLLSNHKNKAFIDRVQEGEAGGWSYLLKESIGDLEALTRALEGSASGLMVLDPLLVASLRPKSSTPLMNLTPRQLEVLELMAGGYSNAGIAKKMVLGEKSVENYINAIYQQLLTSREQPKHPRVTAVLLYLRNSQSF